MKKLIITLVIALLIYCGYWFAASRVVASGAASKIEAYRAQGYVINHSAVDVTGFPLRFDAELGPVSITAPAMSGQDGARATLEKADVSAAAYMPLAWTVTHSGPGSFDIPAGTRRWLFDSVTDAADITIKAGASGGIKALKIDARGVAITATGSDVPPVKSLTMLDYDFTHKNAGAVYKVTAGDITLLPGAMGQAGRALGETVENISGIMSVSDYGTAAPTYQSDNFSLIWGPADMGGAFNLARSDAGLSGTVSLNVANEQTLISELTRKGVISSGEAMIAGLMIGGLPKTEDGRRQIKLSVRDSALSLGPIKLGRLPF